MVLTLITDALFSVVCVPAVVLLGVSKSDFGAGWCSLAVPLMALAISVPHTAAIRIPVLLVMDLLGMAAFEAVPPAALTSLGPEPSKKTALAELLLVREVQVKKGKQVSELALWALTTLCGRVHSSL